MYMIIISFFQNDYNEMCDRETKLKIYVCIVVLNNMKMLSEDNAVKLRFVIII